MNPLNRVVLLGLVALNCTFWVFLPPELMASDALFQGVVVSERGEQPRPDPDKDSRFGGVVIDDQRGGADELNTATGRVLGLGLPAAGPGPREMQRLRDDRRPSAPRIGVSIGIGIGRSQSSPAPAKKTIPIRPIR